MHTLSLLPCSVGSLDWRGDAGERQTTVVVKRTYLLQAGLPLSDVQEPIRDSDLVPFKRRVDCAVVGSAYRFEKDAPASDLFSELRIGDRLSKRVRARSGPLPPRPGGVVRGPSSEPSLGVIEANEQTGYQCAPADQQLDELFEGDRLELTCVHPELRHFAAQLPVATLAAFALDEAPEPAPLTLKADTIIVDSQRCLLTLAARATFSPKRQDVLVVITPLQPAGADPREIIATLEASPTSGPWLRHWQAQRARKSRLGTDERTPGSVPISTPPPPSSAMSSPAAAPRPSAEAIPNKPRSMRQLAGVVVAPETQAPVWLPRPSTRPPPAPTFGPPAVRTDSAAHGAALSSRALPVLVDAADSDQESTLVLDMKESETFLDAAHAAPSTRTDAASNLSGSAIAGTALGTTGALPQSPDLSPPVTPFPISEPARTPVLAPVLAPPARLPSPPPPPPLPPPLPPANKNAPIADNQFVEPREAVPTYLRGQAIQRPKLPKPHDGGAAHDGAVAASNAAVDASWTPPAAATKSPIVSSTEHHLVEVLYVDDRALRAPGTLEQIEALRKHKPEPPKPRQKPAEMVGLLTWSQPADPADPRTVAKSVLVSGDALPLVKVGFRAQEPGQASALEADIVRVAGTFAPLLSHAEVVRTMLRVACLALGEGAKVTELMTLLQAIDDDLDFAPDDVFFSVIDRIDKACDGQEGRPSLADVRRRAEATVLTKRGFSRTILNDVSYARGTLTSGAASMPIYVPDTFRGTLPNYARWNAVAIARPLVSHDAREDGKMVLVGLAVGRLVDPTTLVCRPKEDSRT